MFRVLRPASPLGILSDDWSGWITCARMKTLLIFFRPLQVAATPASGPTADARVDAAGRAVASPAISTTFSSEVRIVVFFCSFSTSRHGIEQ